MKYITAVFALVSIVIILSSCGGTRDMRVQVMRPALITVPQDIQSIAILNRSIPTAKGNLESMVSGEKPLQDKELSQECLRGLSETLFTSNRFVVKQVEYNMDASDPKSLTFGNVLDWATVDSICARLQVNGLLVLEYFDTDFTVHNPVGAAAQAVQGVLTGSQSTVEVTGTATASAGFRVYYAQKHIISYEDHFRWKRVWRQRSANAFEALSKMIKPNAALMDVSYLTGREFGMNIVPLFYWEPREMYKGKKGEMARGERQALSKDWEAALKTWTYVYETSGKNKIRAKAAFNMALCHEVLGNLEEAQKWASTAYVEAGKRPALNYSEIIDRRVREQARLKEQIGKQEPNQD
jgi:hypothetical protein